MPPELVFALPARSAEVSGGNLYNQKLIQALSGREAVTRSTLAECRTRVEQGQAGFYFIDTLDLGGFATFPAPRAGQHFGLIGLLKLRRHVLNRIIRQRCGKPGVPGVA